MKARKHNKTRLKFHEKSELFTHNLEDKRNNIRKTGIAKFWFSVKVLTILLKSFAKAFYDLTIVLRETKS